MRRLLLNFDGVLFVVVYGVDVRADVYVAAGGRGRGERGQVLW